MVLLDVIAHRFLLRMIPTVGALDVNSKRLIAIENWIARLANIVCADVSELCLATGLNLGQERTRHIYVHSLKRRSFKNPVTNFN